MNTTLFIILILRVCVYVCVFVPYRLSDFCVPLAMAVLKGCSASSWSLCRTLWSCCSRSRCWSGRDQSGLLALRTQTSLSRWWWLSGSPSSVPECPVKRRPADYAVTVVLLHSTKFQWRDRTGYLLHSCITGTTIHKLVSVQNSQMSPNFLCSS